MKPNGLITATRLNDTFGNVERIEYRWENGPVVAISYDLAREFLSYADIYEGAVFRVGPYQLKILELEPWKNLFTAIRMDDPAWMIVVLWHRSSRLLDLIYRRMIITLSIWRLADYHPESVPYWGDVHAVQWIQGRIKGKRLK